MPGGRGAGLPQLQGGDERRVMSKHVILHPDDFAKLKLDSPVTMDDGITIERDRFGVTVSGEAKVLTLAESRPSPFHQTSPGTHCTGTAAMDDCASHLHA